MSRRAGWPTRPMRPNRFANGSGRRSSAPRFWARVRRWKRSARRTGGFYLLSRKVRSGDPDNVEAQAARRYWPLLFGEEFRRDRQEPGVNAMLNYAYTVLRAGAARAAMAAGLHPALGLAHRQRGNAFALADDLMEPFRPVADLLVSDLAKAGFADVDKETKPRLAQVLATDMSGPRGVSPVGACLQRLALSAARCFGGEARELELPRRTLPLE